MQGNEQYFKSLALPWRCHPLSRSMNDRAAMILHILATHAGQGDIGQHDEARAVGEISTDDDEIVIPHFLCGVLQGLCERQKRIEIAQCLALDPESGELMAGDRIRKGRPFGSDMIRICFQGGPSVGAEAVHVDVQLVL